MTDTNEDNPKPEPSEAPSGVPAVDGDAVVVPGEAKAAPSKKRTSRFFLRGMATLLPAVLTLWLLVFAYGFIRDKIAAPINWGIQAAIINLTDWPNATDEDYVNVWDSELTPSEREDWEKQAEQQRRQYLKEQRRSTWAWLFARLSGEDYGDADQPWFTGDPAFDSAMRERRLQWMKDQPQIVELARREQLQKKWNSIAIGDWHVLDLIGLVVAFILFYFAGAVMSNVLGRQLKDRGEKIIDRVPLIRRVYPAVKQVTDFFFADSDEDKLKFNRVVAVEYPRKGLFSVGLVTGDTMRDIEAAMGEPCLTVFVPSSPTPFTGYVITVPVSDTIDLGISIEDALKFAVSGGVLVPPAQTIDRSKAAADRRTAQGDRRSDTGDRRTSAESDDSAEHDESAGD